ncbi:PREDICTED: N-acyl-phosphatidylethanolamine-hydrolyzing phospholipase D-like isoform X2 [Priapulus caudatus]|uniref:N-acyl-phosphatidylethanolamine-hydrolyzing phospholipase D-like isoform X2 n=1 Tax=Priapulus caudatus TaxID=37621 RepID=A0ABM1F4H0_PRICU|nr:PREDICTED: N-acyl-phosphatidylethanolamine-hydrolyzing phospholipase D-like isoform X2 [Priapulus caudatus]
MKLAGNKTWKPAPNKTGSTYSCPWTDWVSPNPLGASSWSIGWKSFTAMGKWLLDKRPTIPRTQELDRRLPILPIDFHTVLQPTDGVRVTWIGHATSLVQFDGINLLTDPMFSERAAPTQVMGPPRYRLVPPNLWNLLNTPEMKIHAVLISHNHYDHLDSDSVIELNSRFPEAWWFVPEGLDCWFKEKGCKNTKEMTWWQEQELPTHRHIKMAFTPAQHWCQRLSTGVNHVLWGSWAVIGPKHRFFFAGDTGYCDVFKSIGEEYGPFDVATIPIGCYEPRWYMCPQHVNPEEAVKIHMDIRAKQSVAIHWGTFNLSNEEYDQPVKDLHEARAKKLADATSFIVLKHGQTKTFPSGASGRNPYLLLAAHKPTEDKQIPRRMEAHL